MVASPSGGQLSAIAEGDFAILTPPPSKADQFGIWWGPKPIYLRFSPSAPINAARELAKLEVARAVPAGLRSTTPLFTNPAMLAFTASQLDTAFNAALAHVCPASDLTKYTVHSFRIYLACALLAANASPATIQALVRWRST